MNIYISKKSNKSIIYFLLFLFISLNGVSQNYNELINNHLSNNLKKFDLNEADITEWRITSQSFSKKSKVRHFYLQQFHNGIPVFNAVSNVSIRESDNKIISSGNSFVKNLASKVNSVRPTIQPKMAISQVASALNLGSPNGIELKKEEGADSYLFSKSGISQEEIPVKLVYQPLEDGTVKLSWLLDIYQLDGLHWWNVRVDANTGKILQKNDWGVHCNFDILTQTHNHPTNLIKEKFQSPSILKKNTNLFEGGPSYNVLALPIESPNHGAASLVTAPHNTTASPFGWHDTDGVEGAEYTITKGNNVLARLDANIQGDYSPEGGEDLVFNFPLDINQNSSNYQDASITNLFYVNNMMHDIWYQYGFDESAGNFQNNNYGKVSDTIPSGDEVLATAHDSGGKNNATFFTTPEGDPRNSRMRMFLFDNSSMNITTGSLSGSYTITEADFTNNGNPSGLKLINGPITADLVLMNDNSSNPTLGCSSGASISGLEGKIVVMEAPGCSFVSKVQLAQDNNAAGVIIVNSSGGILRIGGETSTINIPTATIPLGLGLDIIGALNREETINVTLSDYNTDGSLDNGIIAHEYGHGISNRLIGGPANASCMQNQEQMGEGWSDYFALAVTMRPDHTKNTLRGIGTFASTKEPITGKGIRQYPYTTNKSVNRFLFRDVQSQTINGSVGVHGVGAIWASMLWDLNWKMIDVYGFDEDLFNGNGGNNKTMALVIEGLKLTPCNSGFVAARDAILAADTALYGGIHHCVIWEAFAERGLGFSASSGNTNSIADQIEAFDMPPEDFLSSSVCNALSVNEESVEMFKVYPNPASKSVNISLVDEVKNATTTIYDIKGRQVYVSKSDLKGTVTINTENLSAGIYVLKINSLKINYSKKLVIE